MIRSIRNTRQNSFAAIVCHLFALMSLFKYFSLTFTGYKALLKQTDIIRRNFNINCIVLN